MRIVGGAFKGRNLVAPAGMDTRPTADAHRETLFNILQNSMGHEPRSVLDIFAGTGSLGLEALSRGAERAVFVESSPKAIKALQKNLEQCRIGTEQALILSDERIDFWPRQLRELPGDHRPFDIVFCDPPYRKKLVDRAIFSLEKASEQLFASGRSLLVAETSDDETMPKVPEAWEFLKDRTMGSTRLLFYRRR